MTRVKRIKQYQVGVPFLGQSRAYESRSVRLWFDEKCIMKYKINALCTSDLGRNYLMGSIATCGIEDVSSIS